MFLRIGTRKSKLALIQTELVITELKKFYPLLEYEIIPITTTGDKIITRNLYDIGGKALFLKELEEALHREEIDLAVHSLKDVPGNLAEEFEIAAVLERRHPFEVFVSRDYTSIEELPLNAVVGSSSVRRKTFLKNKRPDLDIVTFRGNVDSRIDKVLNKHVDATLLTAAGLYRLNLFNPQYCYPIPLDEIIPSPCQGVVGVEILRSNKKLKEICKKINHESTYTLIQTERSYLEYLNANCTTPVGAYAYYENNKIIAKFMLAHDTEGRMYFHEEIGNINEARQIGVKAAKAILNYKD